MRNNPEAYIIESLFLNLTDKAREKEKNFILFVKNYKNKEKSIKLKQATQKVSKKQLWKNKKEEKYCSYYENKTHKNSEC